MNYGRNLRGKISKEDIKQFIQKYFSSFKTFDGYASKTEGQIFCTLLFALEIALIEIVKYSAILIDKIDYVSRMSGYGRHRRYRVIINWSDIWKDGNVSRIIAIFGIIILIGVFVPFPSLCARRFRDAGIPFAFMPIYVILLIIAAGSFNILFFGILGIVLLILFSLPRGEKVKKMMLKEEEDRKKAAEFARNNKIKYSVLDEDENGGNGGNGGDGHDKFAGANDFDKYKDNAYNSYKVDLSDIDNAQHVNYSSRRNNGSSWATEKSDEHERKLKMMGAELQGMAMAAAYNNARVTEEYDAAEDEKIRAEVGNEEGKISLNGRKLVVDSPSEVSQNTGYKSEFGFYGGSSDSE